MVGRYCLMELWLQVASLEGDIEQEHYETEQVVASPGRQFKSSDCEI